MSWFSKKKFEENKKEVKSHVESHKVLRIDLTFAFGTHNNYTMIASDDDSSFKDLKETISVNIGKNYVLETSNGSHNLKYFCSVTFEEKEVSEVVIDE